MFFPLSKCYVCQQSLMKMFFSFFFCQLTDPLYCKLNPSNNFSNRYSLMVVAIYICWPTIEFLSAVYIINPVFQLVLAGYQPALVTWYIALIPQALMFCLCTHKPGLREWGLCVYIRQSTSFCGTSINILFYSRLVLQWPYILYYYYLVERKTKSYKTNLSTSYTYVIKTAIKQKCI